MKIPSDFFTAFNDVTYYDDPHEYHYDGKKLTSVTTLISKFEDEFDVEYWSDYKAKELGRTQQSIKDEWKLLNDISKVKGSEIHDYAENLFLNKVFTSPKEKIINQFGIEAWEEYLISKKNVDKFYNDTKGRLIPIKTEMIVYDIEYLVGGMIDIVFFNVKANQFQLWDHKTNKKFDIISNYFLKGLLSHIPNTKLDIYSLQLSLYKYIIEKNSNIELGDSYIVWYGDKEKYHTYKVKDYSKEAEDMLLSTKLNF